MDVRDGAQGHDAATPDRKRVDPTEATISAQAGDPAMDQEVGLGLSH